MNQKLSSGSEFFKPNSSIRCEKLLLVEGKDDEGFFKALLKQLQLEDIEIRNFDGTPNFSTYLKTLKVTPGFSEVASLGIVRDADKDYNSAFQSICTGLQQAKINIPKRPLVTAEGEPKVTVYIFPDCQNSGMLETLCLKSLENDPVFPCMEEYFTCMQNHSEVMPKNLPKAKLGAFLASRQNPNLLVSNAARAGYFPWDNPVFDLVKQFIQSL